MMSFVPEVSLCRQHLHRSISLVMRAFTIALTGSIAVGLDLRAQDKPENEEDAKTKVNAFVQQMRSGRLACPLDLLTNIPEVWSLTPDRLDAAFAVPKGVEVEKNPFFQWMTTTRTRAVFVKHVSDIHIKDIPMVDQGPKGYCVVASAQRLFEYYGVPTDQHQLAQLVGTDARAGTNILAMAGALGKIDYRFKTRFKILAMASNGNQLVEVDEREMAAGKNVSEVQFNKKIYHYIDGGIPLLWGVTLGRYPEFPPIAQQASGGHMRMIIGYNDKTKHILFSDSWGAGHELKRMTASDAFHATQGLFAMFPTVR